MHPRKDSASKGRKGPAARLAEPSGRCPQPCRGCARCGAGPGWVFTHLMLEEPRAQPQTPPPRARARGKTVFLRALELPGRAASAAFPKRAAELSVGHDSLKFTSLFTCWTNIAPPPPLFFFNSTSQKQQETALISSSSAYKTQYVFIAIDLQNDIPLTNDFALQQHNLSPVQLTLALIVRLQLA